MVALQTEAATTAALVQVSDFGGGFRSNGADTAEVLKGLDMSFRRSALTAIVGETGSGKSLLGLNIIGLQPRTFERTRGSIMFDGIDLTRLGRTERAALRGRRIGMVFQDSRGALNPVFTIGRQLADVCRLHHGLSRTRASAMAEELLREVQITEPRRRLAQYAHQLSGGTVQRIQLAMVLACRPDFVILDEPTTGLDVTIQADILELIVRLMNETGMTGCLITHDLGVVAEACQDLIVMRNGEVCESGTCREVLTRPQHLYTAELVAAASDEEGPA